MTYCCVVAVLALVGLTKKLFGHYAILKILSLRSPSDLYTTFLVNNHNCVVKYATDTSGFKIPTKIVLDLDASHKH